MEQTHTCKFCGANAPYQFKNGDWCCQPNSSKCPSVKEKLSSVLTGRNHPASCKEAIRNSIKMRKLRGDYSRTNFRCRFCGETLSTTSFGIKNHELHCKSNPQRKSGSFFGHTQNDETRKRISVGMKIAHSDGRASSWIGRRKRSYAEQSWFNIFKKAFDLPEFHNNFFVKEFHYWLDFAWPEKKIYFEVDGETHKTKDGLQHDIKRTNDLASIGWELIGRCDWGQYQKLSFDKKKEFVDSVLEKINRRFRNG